MPAYKKHVPLPGKSAKVIYAKIESEIDRFLSKTPLGKYELKRNVDLLQIEVKSSMFTAVLKCEEGIVILDGSLSLMATPFKGALDEGIDKWIKKNFA
ncbi:MAG: hypothetical protein KA715_13690 [Xanthomonadaceae bacterium]|nr:hypothetical protein [Xanthomonadaceae bacterium]